jgi:hypothetical protein
MHRLRAKVSFGMTHFPARAVIAVNEFLASSPNCAVKVFVTRRTLCETASIAACTAIANSVGPVNCTSATTSRGRVGAGFACNAGFTLTAGATNDTCGTYCKESNGVLAGCSEFVKAWVALAHYHKALS